MNIRILITCLAISALLSSGCSSSLEREGADSPGAKSLALSVKLTGYVPENQTKMTAVITQDGSGFRGIEEVFVVPFQTPSAVPVTVLLSDELEMKSI